MRSAGRGVFDGNVKVERAAQQTDAKQLSRNLLLVPRATVNVKPNLQIVADDVKCTHGCTVSDLEESQLFYFRCWLLPAGHQTVCGHTAFSLSSPSYGLRLDPYLSQQNCLWNFSAHM